jgi:hypothetical protein
MKIVIVCTYIFISLINVAFGKSILVIGDSHLAGPFGLTLDGLLRQNKSDEVRTYGVCGARATSFAHVARMVGVRHTTCGYFERTLQTRILTSRPSSAPSLKTLLKHPTDYLIVALGTNYVNEENFLSMILDTSEIFDLLVKFSPQTKCLWIGPPNIRRYQLKIYQINRILKNFIGHECEYFDSYALTKYPEHGGDGIHFAGNEQREQVAEAWAQMAFERFSNFAQ